MLIEEHIKCYLEDSQLGASRGFFRSLPLISSLYNPVYTYHASKWYHNYFHNYGSYDNLFYHKWAHVDEIKSITDIPDTFAIILSRHIVENLETSEPWLLDNIIKSVLSIGIKKIILSIDDTQGFRISIRRVRPIESIVRVSRYDILYRNWTKNVDQFYTTISCKSKNIILKAYGIYEQARINLGEGLKKEKQIENFEDMMCLEYPLIVMDILHKIMQKINQPDPSTHIKVSDIVRYLIPWFENRSEFFRLRNRCCELIESIPNYPVIDRRTLNRRIESELRKTCKSEKDISKFLLVKGVMDNCVV